MFRDGEAVAEQALAAVGRRDQRMQRLKPRHRFAIGIVGVQPEPQVGVRQVLRLRDGADVEDLPVVGFRDSPRERRGLEDAAFVGRHIAQEGDTVLQQPLEPPGAQRSIALCLGECSPGKVVRRVETCCLEPRSGGELRSTRGAIRCVRPQPLDVKRRGARLGFPFDVYRAVAGHRRPNLRVLGQIRDIDEPLSAVGVAVLA